MADFSLRDAWWLQPKGPDNPLPALQLGVQMSQYKSSMLLKEKDLANDIARTELMRQELAAKMQIQTRLTEGNTAIASAIAGVTDWTDDEQLSSVWETGAQYPNVVGGKAWLGAQHMYESARTAKRLGEESKSRIEARTDRSELNALIEERRALLADSTIDLNDARIRDLDSDIGFAERRAKIQEGNLELRREELSQKGQRLSIRSQRMYDNELKALNEEEKAKLSGISATGDDANLLRKNYNLKRRALTEKFYGPATAAPAEIQGPPYRPVQREGLRTEDRTTNAPPAVAAPVNDARAAEIRASFREGKITKEQALEQLRELGFK